MRRSKRRSCSLELLPPRGVRIPSRAPSSARSLRELRASCLPQTHARSQEAAPRAWGRPSRIATSMGFRAPWPSWSTCSSASIRLKCLVRALARRRAAHRTYRRGVEGRAAPRASEKGRRACGASRIGAGRESVRTSRAPERDRRACGASRASERACRRSALRASERGAQAAAHRVHRRREGEEIEKEEAMAVVECGLWRGGRRFWPRCGGRRNSGGRATGCGSHRAGEDSRRHARNAKQPTQPAAPALHCIPWQLTRSVPQLRRRSHTNG